ncbi:MAG: pyruvate kinase [Gammaproteobacteria bacterium]|jgi:pyruvate kinase
MSIVTELDFLKYRRTKIVATIGPASADPATIHALINAGVGVFRINMSHGAHESHRAAIAAIRESAATLEAHTAILADLCGPKIRTGKFAGGAIELEAGAEVTVTSRDVLGDTGIIPSQYESLPRDVAPGNRILLNDGAVELEVLHVEGPDIACRVVAGGPVGDHKGINLPGVNVSAPSLTEKDRTDAAFALAEDVDFIALSFVRSAVDIQQLVEVVSGAEHPPLLIAKIEKPEALENNAEILALADGIMVARGDLGVELSPEQVPIAQHQLINLAIEANKPVIVATQMLESMIENARPTRAEVTDVSTAVASGTDAVMLSGETAVGRHPVRAVAMMDRVARQTESYHWHLEAPARHEQTRRRRGTVAFGKAIANAAARLVADMGARAVLVISNQGMTAATISAARPEAPVIAISRSARTCRRMNLMWGVVPHLDRAVGQENPTAVARRVARELGVAAPGELVVLVRGFHADAAMNTPSVTLLTV